MNNVTPSVPGGSTQNEQGNEPDSFRTFQKRPGTVDQGKKYEALISCYLALKCCFNDEISDFEMTTNDENLGAFDDISLKLNFLNGTSHTFLLQLKHSDSPNDKKKYITTSKLTKDKDFMLSKYRKSFLELKNRENVTCILYTNMVADVENIPFQLSDVTIVRKQLHDFDYKELLLDKSNSHSQVFQFEAAKLDESNSRSQVVQFKAAEDQEFFKSFYLFTRQNNAVRVQKLIDQILTQHWGLVSNDDVNMLTKYMEHWWSNNFVLNKSDFISKMAEIAFSPWIQTLTGKHLNQKTEILWEAIMEFDTTVVKDSSFDLICHTWNRRNKTIAIDQISRAALKYGLSNKGIKGTDELSDIDLQKTLWYLDKLPLVVKSEEWENNTRLQSGIELLKKVSRKRKLILLGDVSEDRLSQWKTFKNLQDLKEFEEIYKEISSTFLVSPQGRNSVPVQQFINDDEELPKIIGTRELFKMSCNSFCIGVKSEKLLPDYIPRTVKMESGTIIKDKEIYQFITSCVNVMSAQPGMGKSTMMSYLSVNCPPKQWTVKLNLINHIPYFQTNPRFKDILSKLLDSELKDDMFLCSLKEYFLKNRNRIVLILDGLDEIDKGSVEFVLKYIEYISKTKVTVWLSSRQNLSDQICNSLNVSPMDIEEFTDDQKKEYIRKRLCEEFEDDVVEKIIEKVFSSAAITNSTQLLGVPLLLYIITENLLLNQNLATPEKLNEEIFVLPKLCYTLFEGKKEHYYSKIAKEGVRDPSIVPFENILEQYESLGLKVCLSNDDFVAISGNTSDTSKIFLEKIKEEGDPLGIIVGYQAEDHAIFSHQIFAEYFAARWLKNHKNEIKSLQKNYFSKKYDNLRLILDIMLAENAPLHLSVIYKNEEQFKQQISNFEQKDLGGRSALHLVCCYGTKIPFMGDESSSKDPEAEVYQKMLKQLSSKCNIFEQDDIFNWNAFDYSMQFMCLYTVEFLLQRMNSVDCQSRTHEKLITLAYWSSLFGYRNFQTAANIDSFEAKGAQLSSTPKPQLEEDLQAIDTLINNGFNVNKIVEDGKNVLHIASSMDLYAIVDFLLNRKAITNINLQDSSGKTALHYCSDIEIANVLIENGINATLEDQSGKNVLDYAIEEQKWQFCEKYSTTAAFSKNLNYGVYTGNSNVVESLLNNQIDVSEVDLNNNTYPLDFASNKDRLLHDRILKMAQEVRSLRKENKWSLEEIINYWRTIYSDQVEGESKNLQTFIYIFYGLCICFDNHVINFELIANQSDNEILIKRTFRDKRKVTDFIKFKCSDDCLDFAKNFQKLANEKNLTCYLYVDNEEHNSVNRKQLEDNNQSLSAYNKKLQLKTFQSKTIPKNLYCFTSPNTIVELKILVTQALKRHSGVKDPADVAAFLKFMEKAWCNNIVIQKHDMIAKLSELIFSPYLQVLTPTEVTAKSDLLVKTIMIFDITIVKDSDDDTVRHFWEEMSCNDDETEENIARISDAALKYGLSAQEITEWDQLPALDQTKVLWYLRKVPLIIKVKEEEIERIKHGIKMLQREKKKNKLILLGDIPRHSLPQWQIFENLHDVSKHKEIYSDITTQFSISFQDNPGIALTEIINNDPEIARNIETRDLFQMAQEIQSCSFAEVHFMAREGFHDDLRSLPKVVFLKFKDTLLHSAAEASKPNESVITLLLEKGCDINSKNSKGETALHLATRKGINENVVLLLANNAQTDVLTNWGDTPLHYAAEAEKPNQEVLNLLIRRGININTPNLVGVTALCLAAKKGIFENFEILFHKGADFRSVVLENTILHFAAEAEKPNTEIIEVILGEEVDINKPNEDGETALYFAARNGIYENVKILLDNGANLNVQTKHKETILHSAVKSTKPNEITINLLLRKGLKVNQKNLQGQTALHLAARYGIYDNIEILLSNGANHKLRTKFKDTVLHSALRATEPNIEVINLLLSRGVDVNLKNSRNETVLDLAVKFKQHDISALLSHPD